jgi:hypothetical protein
MRKRVLSMSISVVVTVCLMHAAALATILIQAPVTVSIPNGFLTGKDYLAMSEQERTGYVMGFVNGLTVAPLLGVDPERFLVVEERMLKTEVTNLDYVAILTEYIAKRPGNLERGLNILSYEAFRLTFVPNL